jgi:DNA-binding LacI/PurR family transcriptional regulator
MERGDDPEDVDRPPVIRSVTLESVASRAGVSRGTAQRVLAGSLKVSPRAVEAVTRAAAELRYTPNRAARSLRTRRTDSVGFVVTEPDDRLFSDPFFPLLLRGGHAELAARGMQQVLVFASDESDRARLLSFASAGHVDGLVLLSLHGPDPLPNRLVAAGIDVVLGGRPLPDDGLVPYVDADNRGGAHAAVDLLIARGCRRIATIAGPPDMIAGHERLAGFRDAHRDAGMATDERLVCVGDFSHAAGVARMRELLERVPTIDGVFAASDRMALGALTVLREAGRRVPDDVAVVGFDDLPEAQEAGRSLTTVRQPIEEMGRQMVRLLLDRRNGTTSARRLILPTELVRRATA